MKLTYTVVAGKYDGHDRNTKHIATFDTLEDAFDDVAKGLHECPFCEIEVHGALDEHKFIIDCTNPVYVKRLKG